MLRLDILERYQEWVILLHGYKQRRSGYVLQHMLHHIIIPYVLLRASQIKTFLPNIMCS